jgi:hypothetical protein
MSLLANLSLLIALSFALPIGFGLTTTGLWRNVQAWRVSLLALASAALYLGLIYILATNTVFFKHSDQNWLGKIAAISMLLALYAALPQRIKQETGIQQLPHPTHWGTTLIITLATLVFFVLCSTLLPILSAHLCHRPTAQALGFAATLPGIDEELAFRGILLALLVSVFGKPWRIMGISVGWGAVAVTSLFGFAHGFEAAAQGAPWLITALISLISSVMGVLLLWLKEKTGSIWLGVVIHNLANVLSALICS